MMKFTSTHEWIDTANHIATIGITDYAQKELGDIVYVELPKVGSQLKAGEEAVVLESTKAAVDLYSPLSGEVIEVNQTLREKPENINLSPSKQGWLFKIRISNPKEVDQLMDETAYNDLIK